MSASADIPASVAVTCTCGAYLEIDVKFAGQRVPCPDCNVPLDIPVLESKRTSGLALASLLVALLGAFTVIGNVVAIGLGALGLRRIARQPSELAGRRLALAGIALGAVFLVVSVAALMWADRLGLDGMVRELAWAGKFERNADLKIQPVEKGFTLTRPSLQWGLYRLPESDPERKNDLILVQPRDDAYVSAFIHFLNRVDDFESDDALSELLAHDLVRLLAGKPLSGRGSYKVVSSKLLDLKAPLEGQEMVVDVALPGPPRRWLVRLVRRQGHSRTAVLAAAARAARFDTLEPQFRGIFDTLDLDRD